MCNKPGWSIGDHECTLYIFKGTSMTWWLVGGDGSSGSLGVPVRSWGVPGITLGVPGGYLWVSGLVPGSSRGSLGRGQEAPTKTIFFLGGV